MNSNIYYIAIPLLGMLLTASSCNKNQMPDENKDWNVLEWTVDGKRYKAECEGDPLFGCDPVDCLYYNDTKSLEILGGSIEPGAIYISFLKNLSTDGSQYKLQQNDYLIYTNSNYGSICRDFKVDTIMEYLFRVIELDTIEKVIEGQYSFTGINDCEDTVKVSEGYFKLSYRP